MENYKIWMQLTLAQQENGKVELQTRLIKDNVTIMDSSTLHADVVDAIKHLDRLNDTVTKLGV